MHSTIGNVAFRAGEGLNKGNLLRNVSRRTLSAHWDQSAVRDIQLYSDMSETKFGVHTVQFYRLHITFLTFPERWRPAQIINGDKKVPYLPLRNATYGGYGPEYVMRVKRTLNNIYLLSRSLKLCYRSSTWAVLWSCRSENKTRNVWRTPD